MAESNGISSGMFAASQALDTFTRQIRQWRDVYDRLLDLHRGLFVCRHVFERWQHKWNVDYDQPTLYLRALFGHEGCHNIRLTLSTIKKISNLIQVDVDGIIGRALRFGPTRPVHDKLIEQEFVEECLQRIRRRTSWKHKFILSVWNRAEILENSLARLEVTLRVLESYTNHYLEKEHPGIFSEVRRRPGRKLFMRLEAGRSVGISSSITDTLTAQRDAELLHRASDPDNSIHIGLCVPRIHPKDFAFLLRLDSKTHEFLVRPVRITASNNSRIPHQLSSAVQSLSHARRPSSPCVVQPSSTTDGFELTTPPVALLSALESKAPLSSILTQHPTNLHGQILYPQDQNALASGFAQSSLRLLGTPWLRFLATSNIRWRRTTDGKWTSMLTASPSDGPVTRTLDSLCAFYASHPLDPHDLTRHTQVFRLGLVLTELCLRTRIHSIERNARTGCIRLFLPYPDKTEPREVTATEIAAQVDLLCNPFLGDMVFFCLAALMDNGRLKERDVQGEFVRVVVGCADGLERLIETPGRKGWAGGSSSGSSVGESPRSGVFARSG